MYYVAYCVLRVSKHTIKSACSSASELIFNLPLPLPLPQSDLRPLLGFDTERMPVPPTFWTKVMPLEQITSTPHLIGLFMFKIQVQSKKLNK